MQSQRRIYVMVTTANYSTYVSNAFSLFVWIICICKNQLRWIVRFMHQIADIKSADYLRIYLVNSPWCKWDCSMLNSACFSGTMLVTLIHQSDRVWVGCFTVRNLKIEIRVTFSVDCETHASKSEIYLSGIVLKTARKTQTYSKVK